MLDIHRVKELVGDATFSDEDAERVRDECQTLAELIWEASGHQASQSADGAPPNENKRG